MSQIYGTINANNNGNIYLVNPSGVQISNSAQINVGSLYVSNARLDEKRLGQFNGTNINDFKTGTDNATLMSLGNINATKVTFDGDRIIIDTERLKNNHEKLNADKVIVQTTPKKDHIVLGYEIYDKKNKTYAGLNNDKDVIATVNGTPFTKKYGYMWVENLDQLQAINTNLSGNYALRNGIDAVATETDNFTPIGTAAARIDKEGHVQEIIKKDPFTGRFDGLGFNIFDLHINQGSADFAGLFGYVDGADIRNVSLIGGQITGRYYAGSVVGYMRRGTIANVTNSAAVTGYEYVGGLVGYSGRHDLGDESEDFSKVTDVTMTSVVNAGTVNATSETENDNGIGGIVGKTRFTTINGNTYNYAAISGKGLRNVGGIVGNAWYSTIGSDTGTIQNRRNITGQYAVGGIAGYMTETTIRNAENHGDITATGYGTKNKTYDYFFTNFTTHAEDKKSNLYESVAGGIVGRSTTANVGTTSIINVLNTGNVSSLTDKNGNRGGHVGGIVGRAENTNITNATNKGDVSGAYNVGGIAGYIGKTYGIPVNAPIAITDSVNEGTITATGARYGGDFAKETVSGDSTQRIIGNVGGIVGYIYGGHEAGKIGGGFAITNSFNRGAVHAEGAIINTGGIAGRIDGGAWNNVSPFGSVAISGSSNTGDIKGYMNVGGIAGMMYRGQISASYNLGDISSTQRDSTKLLNMGGIVGDATEDTAAQIKLSSVYNKGQVGDSTYTVFGRNVGGLAGRLSGTIETSYNTGDVYNGADRTGGIAGYWGAGTAMTNVFNTGNITVKNQSTMASQVGGLVGAANTGSGNLILSNAYNLGILRSFKTNGAGDNTIGGIVGNLLGSGTANTLTIQNVYTTGNIYAGIQDGGSYKEETGSHRGSIVGGQDGSGLTITNSYYIKPENTFKEITGAQQNATAAIAYEERSDLTQYAGWIFSQQVVGSGDVTGNTENSWRIYGDTPILNAFLPKSEDYFSDSAHMDGIDTIQYGTAYDPLLTIIWANKDTTKTLRYNWGDLRLSDNAGLAVYGAGLTVNQFQQTGNGLYGGLIYSEGALQINTAEGSGIKLGKRSELYGGTIAIQADGTAELYGKIQATGQGEAIKDGTETVADIGDISITAGEVNLYGTLTSAQNGQKTTIDGVGSGPVEGLKPGTEDALNDPNSPLMSIGHRFYHETKEASRNGSISIVGQKGTDSDGKETSGDVNLRFGKLEAGKITSYGNLTVKGEGDIYMDSDLDLRGNLTVERTGAAAGEIVLDISHIGKVDAKSDAEKAKENLHAFLGHFAKGGDYFIELKNPVQEGQTIEEANVKIAVDLWDGTGFNYKKYDLTGGGAKPGNFAAALLAANVKVNDKKVEETQKKNWVYLWVSDAEQLQAVQKSEESDTDITMHHNYALKNDIDASGLSGYVGIGTNTVGGFQGTFDGRHQSIIGLTMEAVKADGPASAGIFSEIGKEGIVKDLGVISSNFTGTDYAGAVAGVNHGTIENITAFGNVVTANGSAHSEEITDTFDVNENGNRTEKIRVGAAGGIAGMNTGNIYTVSNVGTVKAGSAADESTAWSTAGGIVGINRRDLTDTEEKLIGIVQNSSSNSAVTATADTTYGLGGISGINMGKGAIVNVDSLGVTRGIHKTGSGSVKSSYVGGIAGVNDNASISEAYNDSHITGNNYVGGIAGVNNAVISDVTNGGNINYGETISAPTSEGENTTKKEFQYIGGLVGQHLKGDNIDVTGLFNGRNNGKIYGSQYVGGMVGHNGKDSVMEKLVNDSSAAIDGYDYVGGITGRNEGTIDITKSDSNEDAAEINLVNRGSITGRKYVGGVAGRNEGTITNVNSDVDLKVKEGVEGAAYFGGVAGENAAEDKANDIKKGVIKNATNKANISAGSANYVGGVTGKNSGDLEGLNGNYGSVTGGSFVGGVAGLNETEIRGVTASNEGKVEAKNGGAGGLFGKNTGTITGSTLTNSGTVTGTDSKDADTIAGTGGIFGVNSGKITTTSLKNEVGGNVSGSQNVGGLIGVNTGTITGGRNKADTKYEYQIYNNGVITVTGAGTNIGGLIGDNQGNLTGGYNTGAIEAKNSSNIGGIAGANSGTIDQVFNTVYTANGKTGAITGGTNVGGLVGHNAAGGTVTNGYNTTSVEGSVKGQIVGTNAGSVENVYGTGTLIGGGSNTKATNGYDLSKEGDWTDKGSYTGFNITDKANTSATWRIYKGSGHPLLKMFLTTATYTGGTDFIYNGQIQIDKNKINAGDQLAAYENANGLLKFLQEVNAGHYTITSGQIATNDKGEFNPNNLGYDIDLSYTINKATLNVLLDEISRVYGNKAITNGSKGNYGYNFGDMELTNEMKSELETYLKFEQKTDGAVDGVTGKKKTNNAKNYQWSADFTLSDELKGNYQFDASGATTLNKTGTSIVHKAKLTIDLGTVDRVYGNTDIASGGKYEVSGDNLVNGDEDHQLTIKNGAVKTDDALVDGPNGEKRTNDKGIYQWTVSTDAANFGGVANLDTNYDIITVNAGQSNVAAKTISVKDLLATIVYGDRDKKGFQVDYKDKLNGLVYNDNVTVIGTKTSAIIGSDYENNRGDRNTADVNENPYKDSLQIEGLTLSGEKAKNYHLADTSAIGDIKVTKANLSITLGDISRTYGSTDILNGGKYAVKGNTLVNGDTGLTIIAGAVKDGGLIENGTKTNDAKEYTWTVNGVASSFGGVSNLDKNYNIVGVTAGKSTVKQKELTVGDLLATIVYGDRDKKGFQISNFGQLSGFAEGYGDEGKVDINWEDMTKEVVKDSDYAKALKGRDTADVKEGGYKDSIEMKGLKLEGDKGGNYFIADNSAIGNIDVTRAKLDVSLNDVHMTYGDKESQYEGGYSIKDPSSQTNGIANGDTLEQVLKIMGYENMGFDEQGRTKDALGNYQLNVKDTNVKNGKLVGNKYTGISESGNYDVTITSGNVTIGQKALTVDDLLASIVYGDRDKKGFQISNFGQLSGFAEGYGDEGKVDINWEGVTKEVVKDSDYAKALKGRDTADVKEGGYKDSIEMKGLKLEGDKGGNYFIADNSAIGDIKVTKANLSVTLEDISRTYGSTDILNGGKYAVKGNTLVNGDEKQILTIIAGAVKDGGLIENGTKTNNAKEYTWTVNGDASSFGGVSNLDKNYNIVGVTAGKSTIGKANLVIHPDDVRVQPGVRPHYTGTVPGFVNGDSFDVSYGVSASDGMKYQQQGVYTDIIGFWTGSSFFGKGSNVAGLFGGNYTIDFKPATLTVLPDRSDPHWDYLYKDNPFDKTWNERERKAELHFIDAGMKL